MGCFSTDDEKRRPCLLGIFDVNMLLLYGEGYKSFLRLQEEIIKTTHDLTIFGWISSNLESRNTEVSLQDRHRSLQVRGRLHASGALS
jgi:hypothetical protein